VAGEGGSDVIAVLGSANMDLMMDVERIPAGGETVHAVRSGRYPGGKGANQAVAAARLGESVVFFGKVGRDAFGDLLLNHLRENGVDVQGVERAESLPTGLATVLVDPDGENAIVCAAGANGAVDAEYLDRVFDRIAAADVVLLQFEIPLETIALLLQRLPTGGPTVIVDPAPAKALTSLPLGRIDVLTPNQSELANLTGEADIIAGAEVLRARGVRTVICKAGDRGAYWVGDGVRHVDALAVEAVDTTAAGDAFNGALACAIRARPIEEAIRWANAAGALAVTRRGAQPSLPDRSDVEELLRFHS